MPLQVGAAAGGLGMIALAATRRGLLAGIVGLLGVGLLGYGVTGRSVTELLRRVRSPRKSRIPAAESTVPVKTAGPWSRLTNS